jgi:glycosyltransferase involved in cell wall biosynthesis
LSLISVVVCTYRRVDAVGALLECLIQQTHKEFEVLLIDGSGDSSPARKVLTEKVGALQSSLNIRLVPSPKGLTVQRNRGIAEARGEILVFIDDDVTFGPNFLGRTASLFADPAMRDLGGAAGYDTRNYPKSIDLRWRLRGVLGTVPGLRPGAIDRLGRAVPLSFLQPFSGCKDVGHLYGFCMIFRRKAIGELRFDELLPTYAGEDRDFSSRVGRKWRLVVCGDLLLEHHYDPTSRVSGVRRMFEVGFGCGRSFGKNASGVLDYLELARLIACDFAMDLCGCLSWPSRDKILIPFARAAGVVVGVRSWHQHAAETL